MPVGVRNKKSRDEGGDAEVENSEKPKEFFFWAKPENGK
jgi:hypothetical protein